MAPDLFSDGPGVAPPPEQVCCLFVPQEKGPGTSCSQGPCCTFSLQQLHLGGGIAHHWGGWCRALRRSCSLCSQRNIHHSAWRGRWDEWPGPVQMVTEWCKMVPSCCIMWISSVPIWAVERLILFMLLCKLLGRDLFAHPGCSTPVVSYNILTMYPTTS